MSLEQYKAIRLKEQGQFLEMKMAQKPKSTLSDERMSVSTVKLRPSTTKNQTAMNPFRSKLPLITLKKPPLNKNKIMTNSSYGSILYENQSIRTLDLGTFKKDFDLEKSARTDKFQTEASVDKLPAKI